MLTAAWEPRVPASPSGRLCHCVRLLAPTFSLGPVALPRGPQAEDPPTMARTSRLSVATDCALLSLLRCYSLP